MAESESTEVAKSIPVMTFEGALVTEMEGRLPSVVMDMPEGYARGTHLRLNVEVRVKSIRYEENRQGDMVRQHVFALESVQLASAFAPEDADDQIGGSASAKPVPTPEETELLGIEIGRTADQWSGTALDVEF